MEETNFTRTPGKLARLRKWFITWFRKRHFIWKCLIVIFILWLPFFVFAERSAYSVLFLKIRIYLPFIILCTLLVWGLYKWWKRLRFKGRAWMIGIILALIVVDMVWFKITPGYISSYWRYQTIKKVFIQTLPETDHESIQPIVSIQTTANQQLNSTNTISPPFLIRRDSTQYSWTMSVQPNTVWHRLRNSVTTVYDIPSEQSILDFSEGNQLPVYFTEAENSLLGSNAHTATMRKLSFLDLFSYEVGEPRFMVDDDGDWVQVVPLIKWEGILFPQPTFGGVNVIRQSHRHDVSNIAHRFLFGSGTIYYPSEMKKFKYLQNQNLMPREVTLSIAKSFRFQRGFFAPIPSNHTEDTRIPEIEDDGIDGQPTTAFFKMSKVVPEAKDMLYEYIGLEPFDESKDGLVASLFIPSDGKMVVYVHKQQADGISGITAIPSKVREKFQSIDWTQSRVTAIRPYNRIINGTMQSFWRASIVTRSKHTNGWVTGIDFHMVLVDPRSSRLIEINPEHPETWVTKIQESMNLTKTP